MTSTYLPDSITLKCGRVLDKRTSIVVGVGAGLELTKTKIRDKGGHYRVVRVLAKRLRGREQRAGVAYQPTIWVFSDVVP